MRYSPMLCKLIDKPFDDPGWIFEKKIDGIRIITIKDGKQVKLLTRNNKDKARQFPEIVAAIRELKPQKVVLDGEIAAFRKRLSSFQAIQPRVGQTDILEIKKLVRAHPVKYIVFDLLELEGENWETKLLLARKKQLKTIIKGGLLVYLNHIEGKGIALFKKAKQKRWEGIIGKKKDSQYKEGERGNNWVKIKTHNQQEFVISAYTPGQGKTKDTFGAILVGYYQRGKLVYAGKVGTGFTESERADLRKKFNAIKAAKNPFVGAVEDKNAIWLKPRLVGEFAFGEWTKGGILRQPVYMGLRVDKPPKLVVKEN